MRVEFKGFSRRAVVYGIESADGGLVYIGTTTQVIRNRIRGHIKDARDGSELPIHSWIRTQQFAFTVRLLEEVPEADREKAERKWIAEAGGALLNVTDGGPGMSGNRFAGTGHAEKIAERLRRGSNCCCEACSKLFWRKPSDLKLGHSRFCSRACYQEWQRGKPKTRGRAVA